MMRSTVADHYATIQAPEPFPSYIDLMRTYTIHMGPIGSISGHGDDCSTHVVRDIAENGSVREFREEEDDQTLL